MIAWNADNSGLEKHASHASLRLQLAPTIEHQTAAMLSILERYKWHQFSVVTSPIAGHDDFIQAVRERVSSLQVRQFFNCYLPNITCYLLVFDFLYLLLAVVIYTTAYYP